MNWHGKHYASIGLALLCSVMLHHAVAAADLSDYLPDAETLAGWYWLIEPEVFTEETLFQYINGAAEMYFEYGFAQVVTCEYEHAEGYSIQAEIFEMEDDASAYGIYTLLTQGVAEHPKWGDEAALYDEMALIWKGRFLVTLTRYDAEEASAEALRIFAQRIDERLPGQGQRPDLPERLVHDQQAPNDVLYVQGHLGLSRGYYFSHANIFGVTDGVFGRFEDYAVGLFRYSNAEASQHWFANAVEHLNAEELFTDITVTDTSVAMRDSDQALLYGECRERYIVIVIGGQDVARSRQIIDAISHNFN